VLEICHVIALSIVKMACDDRLKAPSVEGTKHLGRLFGLGPPSELRLFINRKA
jgi:hypothetical protein